MKSQIHELRDKNFKSVSKTLKFYFTGLAIAGLLLVSCNDDDNDSESFNDSELLKTAAVIDRINEEDFQMGMETANEESTLESRPGSVSESSIPSCTVITQTSVGTGFPMTFTVDFGSGCTNNGITRSGSLTITFTGYLLAEGSQMIIARNNYTVNGYEVEGTVTYTNETTGDGPQWSRTVVNGQITTPDGDVYTHAGTRTIRQTEGAATPFNLNDNTFEVISGTATVTRPNGSTLTATITTSLVKHHNCSFISEGVVHLEGTFLDGDLDYGADTCDDIAVYTHSDGTVHTIDLD